MRRGRGLAKIVVVNALDLLYFWMYQPRARHVFRSLLRKMPAEDREILKLAQTVLRRKREIIDLFVHGLVGKSYSRPLSFYLEHHEEYLKTLDRLATGGRGADLLPENKAVRPEESRPTAVGLLPAGRGWSCVSK